MRFGLDPMSPDEIASIVVAAEEDMRSPNPLTAQLGLSLVRLCESHEYFRQRVELLTEPVPPEELRGEDAPSESTQEYEHRYGKRGASEADTYAAGQADVIRDTGA